jgi:hypothetical protein
MYVGTGLANIFGGKEHLVKHRMISTLDKIIFFKGTLFRGLQNLSSLHKIGRRSAEKNYLPFFKHASSSRSS